MLKQSNSAGSTTQTVEPVEDSLLGFVLVAAMKPFDFSSAFLKYLVVITLTSARVFGGEIEANSRKIDSHDL